jgi:hypothetical protein
MKNTTLTQLSLSGNNISDEGGNALLQALKLNYSIKLISSDGRDNLSIFIRQGNKCSASVVEQIEDEIKNNRDNSKVVEKKRKQTPLPQSNLKPANPTHSPIANPTPPSQPSPTQPHSITKTPQQEMKDLPPTPSSQTNPKEETFPILETSSEIWEAQERIGLVITMCKYGVGLDVLITSTNDGNAIKELLETKCNFNIIHKLEEVSDEKILETKFTEIENNLRANRSKHKTAIFVYYSGHGLLSKGFTVGCTLSGKRFPLEERIRFMQLGLENLPFLVIVLMDSLKSPGSSFWLLKNHLVHIFLEEFHVGLNITQLWKQ